MGFTITKKDESNIESTDLAEVYTIVESFRIDLDNVNVNYFTNSYGSKSAYENQAPPLNVTESKLKINAFNSNEVSNDFYTKLIEGLESTNTYDVDEVVEESSIVKGIRLSKVDQSKIEIISNLGIEEVDYVYLKFTYGMYSLQSGILMLNYLNYKDVGFTESVKVTSSLPVKAISKEYTLTTVNPIVKDVIAAITETIEGEQVLVYNVVDA